MLPMNEYLDLVASRYGVVRGQFLNHDRIVTTQSSVLAESYLLLKFLLHIVPNHNKNRVFVHHVQHISHKILHKLSIEEDGTIIT